MSTYGLTYLGRIVSTQDWKTPEAAWREAARRAATAADLPKYEVIQLTPLVRKEVVSVTWEKK